MVMAMPNARQMNMRRVGTAIYAWALLVLCGCAPAPQAAPAIALTRQPTAALWQEAALIAAAPQADAPAIALQGDRLAAAWVGVDADGVHLDLRIQRNIRQGGAWDDTRVLPLPPVAPRALALVPSGDDLWLLFWLDRPFERPLDPPRLQTALISEGGAVLRGPTTVSDLALGSGIPTSPLATAYAVTPSANGGAWAAWVGGNAGEPALYLREIDREGRPLQSVSLAADVAAVTFLRTADARLWLLWLMNDGRLWRIAVQPAAQPDDVQPTAQPDDAQIADLAIVEPATLQLLTQLTPPLPNSTTVTALHAATDGATAYLFINSESATDGPRTWWTAGPAAMQADAAASWAVPQPLAAAWQAGAVGTLETGLNGGAALPALVGGNALMYAAPLQAPTGSTLPRVAVAVWDRVQISILYLQDGAVVAYQPLVAAPTVGGALSLHADLNLHVYLAWSQPNATHSADLLLLTTR
jgi:hypothetical protein